MYDSERRSDMAKKEKEGNGGKGSGNEKAPANEGSQAMATRSGERSMESGGRGMQSAMMPMNPLRWLHDEMDGVFDRFFGRWPATRQPIQPSERFWDMGVEEKDDEILVRAEAPGFDPKDFDIHVGRNALTIQAEHKEESGKDEGNVQRWEQHSFFRSIPLSTPVSADKVEAKYRNGILEVHLPRTEMSPQKRIEVKS